MVPHRIAELEGLVAQLVQRRWAARAALVSDGGDVLLLHSSRVLSERDSTSEDGTPEQPLASGDGVARMLVERIDEQVWVYVDLGGMRLLARLSRAAHAGAATTWLARELGRIGFTVERETLAQD